ncbi:MAG: hypothetical protein LBM16_05750 [Clostridiales bacterium]|nr:hypothetical protein [Clostridiales bacterium]
MKDWLVKFMGQFTVDTWLSFISVILTVISLVSIAVGGLFALLQYKTNSRLKRAEHLGAILKDIRENSQSFDAMYLIEREEYKSILSDYQEWFTKDFFGGSETERIIDKLLYDLSYITYMLNAKLLTSEEIEVLTTS